MATSSKILTVTYGTFSCTLEGFDDPFTTLQMVAEYFRKLAAEDRHFGGVPQMPDTETLKRIAEENNPKGVAAEVGENGIVLRQNEDDLVAQDDFDTDEPLVAFDSVRNNVADDDDTAETESPAIDDPVAVPLTYFRTSRPALDFEAREPEESDLSDDDDEDAGVAVSQRSVEETLAAIRQNVEQAETEIANEAEPDADDGTGPEVFSEAAEDVDADGDEDGDAAEPLILTAEEKLTETTAEVAPAEEIAEEAEEDVELVAEAFEATDDVEEVELTEVAETAEEIEEEEVSSTDADSAAWLADVVAKSAASVEDEAPETLELTEDLLEDDSEVEISEDVAPVLEDVAETLEVEDDAEVEAVAEADPEIEDQPEAIESTLSDEEEAELARELESAMEIDDFDTEVDEEAMRRREERRQRAAALRGSQDGLEREDEALERLLVTTRSKMEKPEQMRRMNALDQLKAAVAATEADRHFTGRLVSKSNDEDEHETADLAAYREDLRRAQNNARLGGLASTAKPRVEQPPLILVSEQRIDEPAPSIFEEHSPQPMHEVAETEGNLALKPQMRFSEEIDDDGEIQGIPADAFSDATNFEDFAERIGAFELQDLLEAAAAYTSIVESKARFSRAQVMTKIAKLNAHDAFSKEAGLRAFGKLLREGKILRVQDGQFAISKASRFSIASRYDD